MAKYSKEFKLEVVKYCIENNVGYRKVASYFKIPSKKTVQFWVRKYQEHGERGIERNEKISYSGKFKQNVIEYMHKNHLSSCETSIHFNLSNDTIVSKWESIYNEKGPQALYENKRGGNRKMNVKKEKDKKGKEKLEDLIEEIEQLRMENAYLKKLQALIQKRTKPQQKKK